MPELLARIAKLIRTFRTNGHLIAYLDPLRGYQSRALNPNEPVKWHSRENAEDIQTVVKTYKKGELDLSTFKLEGIPKDQTFDIGEFVNYKKFSESPPTIEELVEFLSTRYCETLSPEYMHILKSSEREWIRDRLECDPSQPSPGQYLRTLEHLIKTDQLERYLASKFPAAKTFGIEGCWSLIPGLFGVLEECGGRGAEYFEIGMSHRGRLNVLVNLLNRPMRTIFKDLQRNANPTGFHSGDVQYHQGAFAEIDIPAVDGKTKSVHLSLCPNPSHLESINPVVMGKVRYKQKFLRDSEKSRVVGILLHGDASFSGQGVVHETMELSNLDGYSVGGMVHIVINNQIGFTTDPRTGRSSIHPTNVAKAVGAPVFHVNGDDVMGVVRACRLAGEFRQTFKRDAVVNIVCYRKHGHNELDDPRITHPLTYDLISKQPSTLEKYLEDLKRKNLVTDQQVEAQKQEYLSICEAETHEALEYQPSARELLNTSWQIDAVMENLNLLRPFNQTGVERSILQKVGRAVSTLPEDFAPHAKVKEVHENRRKAIESGNGIDFGFAEALAFGTLMLPYTGGDTVDGKRGNEEGLVRRPLEKNSFLAPMVDHPTVHVRLSGQDVERGTFNQRHSCVIDQKTASRYIPLNNISYTGEEQGEFDVQNSSLSEEAVLGFEYGYSLENDNALVVWEAQFGDFANNAQAMIDNFIASGEDKWLCQSGLVLLLPHGYEGQGPEHSSARVERYLALVNDDPDTILQAMSVDEDNLREMFTRLDTDKDGTLTFSELTAIVGSERMEHMVELQGLRSVEGKIDLRDYVKAMTQWLARNEEAKYNMSVCNVTTPANYFHVLRRQIHRPYAKPLAVMSPKYLLHHSAAVSEIKYFEVGRAFDRVISDYSPNNNLWESFKSLKPVKKQMVRKVLICSGKIFYTLHHARRAKRTRDIVIVRGEQIAPFPRGEYLRVLGDYPNAQIVWVQEEPKNMGAWSYMEPRLRNSLQVLMRSQDRKYGDKVLYAGRAPSATTATGSFVVHQEEARKILEDAFE